MKKNTASALSILIFASGLALGAPPAHGSPVNINTADQATLSAVPGIGKHRAEAIVEYRKNHGAFKEVHDLAQVKGLNEKNLKNILKRNPGQITISG